MKYMIDVPDNTTWIQVSTDRLEPYTEPDRKAIEDEVWNLAKTCCDIMDYEWQLDTYQQAKGKIETWKKQEDEIHIGDEVIYNGDRVVVTDIFLQDITRLWIEGVTSSGKTVEAMESDIKKTGRHFPEVEEMLKKMRGEAE